MIVIYTDRFGGTQTADTDTELPEMAQMIKDPSDPHLPAPVYIASGLIGPYITIAGGDLPGYEQLANTDDSDIGGSTSPNGSLSRGEAVLIWRNIKTGVITKRWPFKYGLNVPHVVIMDSIKVAMMNGDGSVEIQYDQDK